MHKFRESTSIILSRFKIYTSILNVYIKYHSEFEDKYIRLEILFQVYFWVSKEICQWHTSISNIILNLKRNTSIWKIYFLYTWVWTYCNYTSDFVNNYINLESLPQVFFWVWKLTHQYWTSASILLLSFKRNTSI